MTTDTRDITSASAAGTGPVLVELLDPDARFCLRVDASRASAAGGALGLELPHQVGRRAVHAYREALCLGPDEWVIAAPEVERRAIVDAMAALYAETPHSLVDISDREVCIRIDGPRAAELLSFGCPRDIDRLPPGSGVRTVFDGAQVVIWRDAADRFRIDVWRSFYPHVLELLVTGNAELATG